LLAVIPVPLVFRLIDLDAAIRLARLPDAGNSHFADADRRPVRAARGTDARAASGSL